MRLSARTIQEFKDICKDEFGMLLSDEEAAVRAARVLELLWSLLVDARLPNDGGELIDASTT